MVDLDSQAAAVEEKVGWDIGLKHEPEGNAVWALAAVTTLAATAAVASVRLQASYCCLSRFQKSRKPS